MKLLSMSDGLYFYSEIPGVRYIVTDSRGEVLKRGAHSTCSRFILQTLNARRASERTATA